MTYPAKCELCGYEITSEDDAMWWHGYGNCVEITDEMWEQWEREARKRKTTMLIRAEDWERIRGNFTEEEKVALRKAIVGETICPRGWTIDTTSTGVPLLGDKLKRLLKERV